jgi:hypothetical protein
MRWCVLFLGLSILTGWMAFASPGAELGPVADVLFLVSFAAFLGAAVAVAVGRLQRQT